MPKSHAYLKTMTKQPAKFQIYKTVWELRTQGTHRLSSNTEVEKGDSVKKIKKKKK